MVQDGAFSHKIDYVTIFEEILNLEGHQNCITGSKVTAVLPILVELHRKGSAPAACASDLFLLHAPPRRLFIWQIRRFMGEMAQFSIQS